MATVAILAGVWLSGMAANQGGSGAAQSLAVSHASRALEPGETVLFTFTASTALSGVSGSAFGQPLAAFAGETPSTWQALAGIDLDTAPGTYPVTVEATTREGASLGATLPLVVAAKAFPTRRLQVPAKFVTPPPTVLARIERERALLARALAPISPGRSWESGFAAPVDGEVISSFGTRSIFNGQPRAPHRGTDFRGATGTPVRAPAAGRVVLTGDLYFSGNTVVIDHGLGVFSLLCHFSRIDVRTGAGVTVGQVVGAVGATGRVTGPHLHWTLRIGRAGVDPLSVMAVAGRH